MLRLNKDVVISSTIPIISEHVSLIGNRTTFLFQEHDSQHSGHPVSSPKQLSSTRTPTESPHSNHHEGIATVFMFDVLNSTFCVEGVHAQVNSDSKSICSLAGSIVRFSCSSITSNSDICPFVIIPSGNGERSLGSAVMLCDVTHHSRSDSIAPFVGLAHPHPSMVSSASADLSDLHNAEMEAIAVIGTGLNLESKELIFETGPLFSFGMNEHGSCLRASGCGLRMETSLLSSTLVNVSSPSSAFSPGKQLFGSEVRQLVVGSCVAQSTNHDSGTGMMSPNFGGNLKCLNTSFSSCVREANAAMKFTNKTITQTSDPGRLSSVESDVFNIYYEYCTFVEMSVHGGSTNGGAAIFLSEQSADLDVRNSHFHKCRCEGGWDNGGAIYLKCGYSRNLSLYEVTFTDCYAGQNGGCVYAYGANIVGMSFWTKWGSACGRIYRPKRRN
ncbi:hypothetical protein BLNAU_12182 [Blattamonas nauphoetae]|uniref:Uncharacterized protein n=1 Tax=Blattamonas nauphoetae TaxID=2049346 RepID=A0ABQ9XLE9_9EUKA|nr:hypothetical protein BLNAU_12182 [Blattamonas nauphoetae]